MTMTDKDLDAAPKPARVRPKNDPFRKVRIMEAAGRVISERGIDALTFRAVAEAAKVPLSSTTYYFSDKDDLLLSSIRHFREQSSNTFEGLLELHAKGKDLAAGLALMIEEMTVRQHARLTAEYGFYLCTLHKASLRQEILGWRMETMLVPYCAPETAKALGFMLEGILLQSVMEDVMFFAADVEPMLRMVTDRRKAT